MKLSEFLTDLENMLQDVMHTASNPYIYGLFPNSKKSGQMRNTVSIS